MEIGLFAAFVGGVLALLSPCGALLLPAYFAAQVGSGPRLLLHTGVFYLGLTITLVPLGLGVGALGAIFATQRAAIVAVTAVVLIVLGLAQILGLGFDLSRALPGTDRLRSSATKRTGLVRSLLFGAASGVAGFCAGPILGAVLTLAAAGGDVPAAGLLLAVYGAGMVVPLLVLAAAWQRLGPRAHTLLRGRPVTIFGRQLHSTSIVTGALIALVGVVFWVTNGFVGAPQLVPIEIQAWLQQSTGVLAHPVVDIAAILAALVLVLVLWRLGRRRSTEGARAGSQTSDEPDGIR